mgnify:CR=1 FL=1
MEHTSEAPDVGSGKATQMAAEKAFDKIAEREGFDENGDEIVDMSGDDEPVAEVEADAETDEPVEEVASGEEVEEEGEAEAAPEAEATTEQEVIEPPHTWPQEWKDAFAAVPPEAQKIMDQQSRLMNRAFTQKMMEVGQDRKKYQGVDQAVQPHIERLQRAGIAPEVAIQRSLAWDAHIQKDPAQGIRDMASAYGVDLNTVIPKEEPERYLTPTERALEEQNKQLAGSVEQVQASMAQWQQKQQKAEWDRRQANAQSMLEEFMNAEDEQGNRLHPYIEHVAPMMTQLIQKGMAEGLDDAYTKAVAWTPEIREAELKARRKAVAKKAREQVAKARKASGGIVDKSGRRGAKKTGQPRSTEAIVSAAYDKLANG